MVFSNKIVYSILFLTLLFIPTIVYAKDYAIKDGNQTIIIVIKQDNSTSGTLVNSTEEDQRLMTIVTDLTEKDHQSWNEGDIIIASSTIIAFFSFNSFLIIRFKRKSLLGALLSLMDNIIMSVLMIQLICIFIIVTALTNILRPESYYVEFSAIGFFIIVIAFSIREIIKYENLVVIQSAEVENTFNKAYEILKKYQEESKSKETDEDKTDKDDDEDDENDE